MANKPTDSDSDEFSDARESMLSDSSSNDADSKPTRSRFANRFQREDSPIDLPTSESANEQPQNIEKNPEAPKSDVLERRRLEEDDLSDDELQRRRLKAMELKDSGNSSFKTSCFTDALQDYSTALDVCPLVFEKERSIILSNRAACQMKLGAIDAALSDCDEALKLQPDYVRCLQRRAGLREQKDRLTDALEDYQAVLKLDPGNEQARWACMTLPDRIQKQQEEMKEKMIDQLKQLGNVVLRPFGLSTDNFKVQKNDESGGYSINFVK